MTDQADYPPLRPCPFCGRCPDGIYEGNWETPTIIEFAVSCDALCGTWTIYAATKAEVADKWNRRAKL